MWHCMERPMGLLTCTNILSQSTSDMWVWLVKMSCCRCLLSSVLHSLAHARGARPGSSPSHACDSNGQVDLACTPAPTAVRVQLVRARLRSSWLSSPTRGDKPTTTKLQFLEESMVSLYMELMWYVRSFNFSRNRKRQPCTSPARTRGVGVRVQARPCPPTAPGVELARTRPWRRRLGRGSPRAHPRWPGSNSAARARSWRCLGRAPRARIRDSRACLCGCVRFAAPVRVEKQQQQARVFPQLPRCSSSDCGVRERSLIKLLY
jgi:hypothetical protein